MKSVNPFNLELIEDHPEDSIETVKQKIERAHKAFLDYRFTRFEERSDLMRNAARVLRDNKEKYAEVMTREMGKPIKEAIAEAEKCAWVCEYYSDHAAGFLADQRVDTDADTSYISYHPIGVVLAVMPWNFPFWQVFRFAAPTLMAGNTCLLKHASNVQQCARLIEEVFEKAGFDKDCFINLAIEPDKVEEVLRHPHVKAASVTGSEGAGQAVAKTCGDEIKTTVLELGGSNAFIVLKDADVSRAAKLGAKARLLNNAQSCIASKRFLVAAEIYDEFVEALKREFEKLKVGDPMEKDTDIGPLSSVKAAENLESQMQKSLDKGAKLITGGKREQAIFLPTILADVQPGMTAFEEELFGPIAAVVKIKDADEAVELNNRSRFGLGASIITNDLHQAREMIKKIDDGAVFVNELVKSDPRMPFGGTKKSGYGRELSRLGILEFVNAKAVHIKRELQ